MVSSFSTGKRLVCWLSVIEHRSIRWFRSMYFERVLCVSGITESNVLDVMETGVVGVAVISAVMGAPDVREATTRLRRLVDRALASRANGFSDRKEFT
jgi:hypothetical protein